MLPPAISPLPQQAAIVARWSADAIAPQADNTALASWADSVGGLAAAQATSAAQPKYRTGGAGGKPYVLFSGAQYLDAGTANAVATACQTKTSSVLVVCRNVQASQYGYLFSASNVTGYCLFASGARVGVFTTGQIPYSGAGLTTVGYTAGLPDQYSGRYYINGTCCSQIGALQSAAGHNVGIGGAPATPSTAAKAEIYDVIVWNRALTAFEMMQAEKWARDKYSSPYPWAGGAFRVFHGDSLTAGYGMPARAEETYPAQVAAANGWPFGSWTNLGYVGTTMAVMRAAATAEIDPMLAVLGDTPMHLATWEWYNQRNATVAGQYGSTGITESYFRARRAAGVAKLVLMTSIDAADPVDNPTNRAAYNAYFDANHGSSICDAYIPIHTIPEIGVEGACPNAAPYDPYFQGDGIHLNAAGNAVLAAAVAPVMAGL
ncbi:MAG: SGNH/GDSL hydrolase family protein [Sphingomonas bacterium]